MLALSISSLLLVGAELTGWIDPKELQDVLPELAELTGGLVEEPRDRDATTPPSEPSKVSLKNIFERALLNHPSIGEKTEAFEKAQISEFDEKRAYFPTLSAIVSPSYDKAPGESNGRFWARGGLGVEQSLFDPRSLVAIRGAHLNSNSEKKNLEAAQLDLAKSIAADFFDYWKSMRRLDLYDRLIARQQKQLELVKTRFEARAISRTYLINMKSLILATEAERSNVSKDWQLVRSKIDQYLGVAQTGSLELAEVNEAQLTVKDFSGLESQILALDPQLEAARISVEAIRKKKKQFTLSFLPRLSASGSYYYNEVERTKLGNRDEWAASLTLTLPIFSSGGDLSNLRNLEAEEVRAMRELEWQTLGARRRLKDEETKLQKIDEARHIAKQEADLAEEFVKISEALLSAGLAITFDDVERANLALLKGNQALIELDYDRLASLVNLRLMLGEGLPD